MIPIYKENQGYPTYFICVGEYNSITGDIVFKDTSDNNYSPIRGTSEGTRVYDGWFIKDEEGVFQKVFPNLKKIMEVVAIDNYSPVETIHYPIGFLDKFYRIVLYDEFR